MQAEPDPVTLEPGGFGHMAFTVTADTEGTETISLTLPDGVAIPPGGVVHYMCPNAPLALVYSNDTGVPVTSIDFPDRSIGTVHPDARGRPLAGLHGLVGVAAADAQKPCGLSHGKGGRQPAEICSGHGCTHRFWSSQGNAGAPQEAA